MVAIGGHRPSVLLRGLKIIPEHNGGGYGSDDGGGSGVLRTDLECFRRGYQELYPGIGGYRTGHGQLCSTGLKRASLPARVSKPTIAAMNGISRNLKRR